MHACYGGQDEKMHMASVDRFRVREPNDDRVGMVMAAGQHGTEAAPENQLRSPGFQRGGYFAPVLIPFLRIFNRDVADNVCALHSPVPILLGVDGRPSTLW